MKKAVASLFAVAAFTACNGKSAPASEEWALVQTHAPTTKLDSAGLRTAPGLALSKDWSVDLTGGDGLTKVTGIAVNSSGDAYVLDGPASSIVSINGMGQRGARFGRAGAGPGEFKDARAVVAFGDTVVVLAPGYIHTFDRNGNSISSVHMQAVKYFVTGFASAGSVALVNRALARSSGSQGPAQDTVVVQQLERSSGRLTGHETRVADAPTYKVDRALQMPTLFGGRVSVAVGGDGTIFVTRGTSYRIDLLSDDGTPTETWAAGFSRIPLNEPDFAAYEKVLVDNAPQLADMDAKKSYHRAFKVVPRASLRPVLGAILPDSGRRALVQRMDSVETPYYGIPSGLRWDLIENGVYRGSVSFPKNVSPRVLRGSFVYCVEYDESDLPTIVRYSIAGAAVPPTNMPRAKTAHN